MGGRVGLLKAEKQTSWQRPRDMFIGVADALQQASATDFHHPSEMQLKFPGRLKRANQGHQIASDSA